MMDLLGRRRFTGACSPESKSLQQPIKVGEASDVDCRRAERHRRASDRIKHPGGKDDRHAWLSLDDGNLSARSSLGVELSDLAAVQGVPAVLDLYVSADMGRMAPR
jgi:hypothetical protein